MLTKRQRKQLRMLQSRHGRRKSDLFLVEGVRCCTEALQRRPEWLDVVLVSRDLARTEDGQRLKTLAAEAVTADKINVLSGDEMAALSDTRTPQGICCVMRRPEPGPPSQLADPFALVLDRVREPGNMGTILRTAWAAGLTHVWLTEGCVDPFSPKVVRAGMGAHFALDLVRADTLGHAGDVLASCGAAPLYLAVPSGGISCFDDGFDLGGSAVVIGNEADGIADLSLGPHVSIPMPGHAESLNVSQAATILIFEGVRRGLL